METSLNITRIERPDDIPLLLAQMQKMDVAALLDEHFPTHGNWQLKHAITQKKALDACLEKAFILTCYDVVGLLVADYCVETQTTCKRAYLGRPTQEVTVVTATVSTSRAATAYNNTVQCLGWRGFVSNDAELGLSEAVLAYREEYIEPCRSKATFDHPHPSPLPEGEGA